MEHNSKNTSNVEYILNKIKEERKKTGINRTLFAACPNSFTVIQAALRSAKRCNAPIMFATTLNQVDSNRGYTGMNQSEFVRIVKYEAEALNLKEDSVIIALDHGGPWLKDEHRLKNLTYDETMSLVKKSMIDSLKAGYELLHVDPTIDITLKKGEVIDIKTVVNRTVEIIAHVEKFRRENGLSPIAYEVGTEEVHGGLADMGKFRQFLSLLKQGLSNLGYEDIWPSFVVGKVGTDLHTTVFDPEVARTLVEEAGKYGSVIKGHYSDNVDNPEQYSLAGMGGANVGPEFTENEYDGLIELVDIEKRLFKAGKVITLSNFKDILWDAVISSGRWKKWLLKGESDEDFYALKKQRKVWLIKTGCRYIWTKPEVEVSRAKLYNNLERNGINAEEIVFSKIEKSMDKYFHNFNLIDFNNFI